MEELTLTLLDNNSRIEILVNKNDLIGKCEYFNNLLNKYYSPCQNKIIIVPNALVSKNIIENLLKPSKNPDLNLNLPYLLELIKCYDFFGLEFDLKNFKLSKIADNEFDVLLDIIDIVGYNDYSIKLLIKNLPNDYDLSKLPHDLLKRMYEIASSYMIVISHKNIIYFFDGNNGQLIKTYEDPLLNENKQIFREKYGQYYDHITSVGHRWDNINEYETNIEKILPVSKNKILYTIRSPYTPTSGLINSPTNLFNVKSEKTTKISEGYNSMSYSLPHNNMACTRPILMGNISRTSKYEAIEIYSLTGELEIKLPKHNTQEHPIYDTQYYVPKRGPKPLQPRIPPEGKRSGLPNEKFYGEILYSPNGKYIARTNCIQRGYYSVIIIEYETGYIMCEYFCKHKNLLMCFSLDSEIIAISYNREGKNYIDLFNIKKHERLDKINILDKPIHEIYFVSNDKFVITVCKFLFSSYEYTNTLILCDIKNKTQTTISKFGKIQDTFYCPIKNHLVVLEKNGIVIINPESGKIKKSNVCDTINQYIIKNFYDGTKITYDYCVAITPNYYRVSKKIKNYLKMNTKKLMK
ncbi:hypothetical protein QLL95_gp0173 [Cotonvirus japonicus]|uniref:BTB/POZ domain-containing protein n=1 Tax=Cotonvirus japonicus TaxID=2811091 RepID=A0ABM7NR76_9VIRU|nr:hypothetical protein QLL95_gp0173 [Cotonvirus japonicus]BCS82662.1 hypothetical protein [Cotonvirus japonicus]